MNEKAKEIGCEDYFFVSPNGLDGTGVYIDEEGNEIEKVHSISATDLATIMRYCIMISPKKEEFLEITRTGSYTFQNVVEENGVVGTGNRTFSCSNHNSFLYMMEGALSGKTGFTNDAGYCYVGALERDGKTFIVALLACGWPYNQTYKWSDTSLLMNYGIDNYENVVFDEMTLPEEIFEPITVTEGQTENIGEIATVTVAIEDISGVEGLLMQSGENVKIVYDVATTLGAPVKAGEKVGAISYLVGNQAWKNCDIIIQDSVEKIDFYWCFYQVLEKWYL